MQCEDRVCPPPYFHDYPCQRSAKYVVDGGGRTGLRVCGVHARWFRKYGTVRLLTEDD